MAEPIIDQYALIDAFYDARYRFEYVNCNDYFRVFWDDDEYYVVHIDKPRGVIVVADDVSERHYGRNEYGLKRAIAFMARAMP